MLRLVFLVLVVLFISGCSISEYQQRFYGNENSPNFRVPLDSTLVLNQELIIGPKRRRVFFQYGKVLARHYQINRYQPWCVLRMDTKKDVEQRVKPDKFVVRTVEQDFLYQVALLGPIQVAQFPNDGTDQTYEVVSSLMQLYSERQPEVVNLACARWRPPSDMFYVTIRSIRETLGDVFTLELALTSAQAESRIGSNG